MFAWIFYYSIILAARTIDFVWTPDGEGCNMSGKNILQHKYLINHSKLLLLTVKLKHVSFHVSQPN
jgi:hypothetical protein